MDEMNYLYDQGRLDKDISQNIPNKGLLCEANMWRVADDQKPITIDCVAVKKLFKK